MGNTVSDLGETEAYDRVIKFIPIVNVGYSTVRAFVYLGKDNHREAKRSGVGVAIGVVETGAWFIPVGGPAASMLVKSAITVGAGAVIAGAEAALEHGADSIPDAALEGAASGAASGVISAHGANQILKNKQAIKIAVKKLPSTAKQTKTLIFSFCKAHPALMAGIAAGTIVVLIVAATSKDNDEEEGGKPPAV